MSDPVYIGVGSNVADPLLRVRAAIARLAGLGPTRSSCLYRTEPLGDPAQPWFVNAVVELLSDLEPPALLERLQALEREAGRTRGETRWSPRVLDLDLLLQGDRIVSKPALELPHPRMCRRRFVLEPLAELAPGLREPVSGRTVAELLRDLDDPLKVEKISGSASEPLSAAVRETRAASTSP